jgi:hypothetical protein
MIGKELIQVCYGKFQTLLRFEQDVTVSIEGNIEHRIGEKLLGRSEGRNQGLACLILLIGASIEDVKVKQENALELTFSNSHTLSLFSDDSPYEAFSISGLGQSVVV